MKRSRPATTRPADDESDSNRRVTRSRSKLDQLAANSKKPSNIDPTGSGGKAPTGSNASGESSDQQKEEKTSETRAAVARSLAVSTSKSKQVSESTKQSDSKDVVIKNRKRASKARSLSASSSDESEITPIKNRKRRGKARPLSESSDGKADVAAAGDPPSPEDDVNCSICLDAVDNKAFSDACSHIFCFACLRQWSETRAVCPLCLKPFTRINHTVNAPDDFQTFAVDVVHVPDIAAVRRAMLQGISGLDRLTAFMERLRQQREAEQRRFEMEYRRAFSQTIYYPRAHSRRHVYATGVMVRELRSPDDGAVVPYRDVTPAELAADANLEAWLAPWLARELSAVVDGSRVAAVQGVVLALVRRVEIASEEFYDGLRLHVGAHTRHFAHELRSFVRAPRDVWYDDYEVYDDYTIYNLAENISSDDEEDVEIIPSPLPRSTIQPTPSDASASIQHEANAQIVSLHGVSNHGIDQGTTQLEQAISSVNLPSTSQQHPVLSVENSSRLSNEAGPSSANAQNVGQIKLTRGLMKVEEVGGGETSGDRLCSLMSRDFLLIDATSFDDNLSVISDDGSDMVMMGVDEPAGSRLPICLSSSEGEADAKPLLSDDKERGELGTVWNPKQSQRCCESVYLSEDDMEVVHRRCRIADEGEGENWGECSHAPREDRTGSASKHPNLFQFDLSDGARRLRSRRHVFPCDGDRCPRDYKHRSSDLRTDLVTANKALVATKTLKTASNSLPSVSANDRFTINATSSKHATDSQPSAAASSECQQDSDIPAVDALVNISVFASPNVSQHASVADSNGFIATDSVPHRYNCSLSKLLVGLDVLSNNTHEKQQVSSAGAKSQLDERNTKVDGYQFKESHHCDYVKTAEATSQKSRKSKRKEKNVLLSSDSSDVEVVDLDCLSKHRRKRRRHMSGRRVLNRCVNIISDSDDGSDEMRSTVNKANSKVAEHVPVIEDINDGLNVNVIHSVDKDKLALVKESDQKSDDSKGLNADKKTTVIISIDALNPSTDRTCKKHPTGHKKSRQVDQRRHLIVTPSIEAQKPIESNFESNSETVEENASKELKIQDAVDTRSKTPGAPCGSASSASTICTSLDQLDNLHKLDSDATSYQTDCNAMSKVGLDAVSPHCSYISVPKSEWLGEEGICNKLMKQGSEEQIEKNAVLCKASKVYSQIKEEKNESKISDVNNSSFESRHGCDLDSYIKFSASIAGPSCEQLCDGAVSASFQGSAPEPSDKETSCFQRPPEEVAYLFIGLIVIVIHLHCGFRNILSRSRSSQRSCNPVNGHTNSRLHQRVEPRTSGHFR